VSSYQNRTDLWAIIIHGNVSASTRKQADVLDIEDLARVKPMISRNKFLQVLAINGQIINESNRETVNEMIGSHPSLEHVDLFDNMMSLDTCTFFFNSVSDLASIKELNLGDNGLDADARTHLKELSAGRVAISF